DSGRNRYVVLVRPEVIERLDRGHERVRFVTLPSRLFWEQLAVPACAAFGRADVVLAAGGVAAIGAPAPQVLLIQNLAPFDRDVIARCRTSAQRMRLLALRELGILSAHACQKVLV